jgi:nicotinamide-nucleotide amidase
MGEPIIESLVGERLRERGLRLAIAESCTGGLVCHRITNVPGSSEYFLGGVIAYAYEAKVGLLDVRWDTLEQYGAVSQQTVLEMARGVRVKLGAEIGLAVSGIAGPGGGTEEKPIGLVWIGLCAPELERAQVHLFKGDRLQVKEQSAEQALRLLADYLSVENEDGRGYMEPIEVNVRYDGHGQLVPTSFIWQEQEYTVESTGRRWQDDVGEHILVMVEAKKVYELVHAQVERRWYLKPIGSGSRMA